MRLRRWATSFFSGEQSDDVPDSRGIFSIFFQAHKYGQWAERGRTKAHELEKELDSIDLFLFHPMEEICVRWNVLVMILMTYLLIAVPFGVCFEVNVEQNHPFEIANLIVDIFLLLDIILTFNTGLIEGDEYISDRRLIAKHYLKGWFTLDVLTSIPFNRIIQATMRKDNDLPFFLSFITFLRILKVLRLVKLLRIMKLYESFRQWESLNENSVTLVFRLSKFLMIMFLMSHISACVFMGITMFYIPDDGRAGILTHASMDFEYPFEHIEFNPSSWIVEKGFDGFGRGRTYLITLYWAFTTLTTVGYGDITAFLPLEIAWTILVMILGTSLFGYIIGNVASVMTHEDETSVLIKNKIKSVMAYMRYRNFPTELANKIKRHYEFSWKRSQVYNEEEIISELPATVQMEVALYIHRETIMKVPFLRELGDDVIPMLVLKLKPILASPRDVIIKEDYFGKEMYFVAEGKLKMYIDGGQVPAGTNYVVPWTVTLAKLRKKSPNASFIKRQKALKVIDEKEMEEQTRELEIFVGQIKKGDYFAEYSILLDSTKHPNSVRTLKTCDLFSMSKAAFEEISAQHPSVYQQVVKVGKKRFLDLMTKLEAKRSWGTKAYADGVSIELIEGEEEYKTKVSRFSDKQPMGLADRWRRRRSIINTIQKKNEKDTYMRKRLIQATEKKKKTLIYPTTVEERTTDLSEDGKLSSLSLLTHVKLKFKRPKRKRKSARRLMAAMRAANGLKAHGIHIVDRDVEEKDAAPHCAIAKNTADPMLQLLQRTKSKRFEMLNEKKGLSVHTMSKIKLWKNRAAMNAALHSMENLERRHVGGPGRRRHYTEGHESDEPDFSRSGGIIDRSRQDAMDKTARRAIQMVTKLEERIEVQEKAMEDRLEQLETKLDVVSARGQQTNETLSDISSLLRKLAPPSPFEHDSDERRETKPDI